MAADNAKRLRLYEDFFNAEGMTDENSLASALLTQPDVLSPVITHLAGKEDKRFPLSFLTEGTGAVKYINDIEYDYPVMGRLNKAVRSSSLVSGSGANYTRFKVAFDSKWFIKQYIIESENGIQARVMDEPYENASGQWVYTLQLVTADENDSIGASDVAGKNWYNYSRQQRSLDQLVMRAIGLLHLK